MGKISNGFVRLKFWLPQNAPFQDKTCAASREDNRVIDASFRFHGEFYAEQVDIIISKNQALQI